MWTQAKLKGMMKSQDIKGSFTFGAPILQIDVGNSVFD